MANEKRLIDFENARKSVMEILAGKVNTPTAVKVSVAMQEAIVDAVEVVHGYWTDSINVDHMGRVVEHGIDCSVCDSVFKDDSREVVKRWKERFKVCPFCGAKMDGGRKDDEC